jgi:type I restriction enzyme, S subunit
MAKEIVHLKDAPMEIIDGDRGANYPSQDQFAPTGFCVFLSAKNVRKTGLDLSECQFISKERDQLLRKGKLKRFDTVLTTRGTVGNLGFYDEKIPFENIRINSGMVILRPDRGKLDEKYCFYMLRGLQSEFTAFSTGTAQPQLPIKDLNEIKVRIPLLDEQRTIASILSSLDDKIDLLHRQNRTLEQLARTLFRQWFVEEGEAGWEEKGLDEIAHFLNGLPCQKYPPVIGKLSLPVVKIKELRLGFTEESDMASAEVPEQYIVHNGDILFSWSGSLEEIVWSFGDGVLNQHLFKVTSETYPQWFYYYWIKHHLPEFRGIAEDKATTMGHIQRGHLSSARVVVPPAPVLKKFDATIGPLFEKMKHNLMQIQTLTKLRDTLLPKLMSGEVRVKGN